MNWQQIVAIALVYVVGFIITSGVHAARWETHNSLTGDSGIDFVFTVAWPLAWPIFGLYLLGKALGHKSLK